MWIATWQMVGSKRGAKAESPDGAASSPTRNYDFHVLNVSFPVILLNTPPLPASPPRSVSDLPALPHPPNLLSVTVIQGLTPSQLTGMVRDASNWAFKLDLQESESPPLTGCAAEACATYAINYKLFDLLLVPEPRPPRAKPPHPLRVHVREHMACFACRCLDHAPRPRLSCAQTLDIPVPKTPNS